jgi:anti-sigma B factor antagonist
MTARTRSALPVADRQLAVETVRFDRLRALIRVSGELDLSTAAPLWAVLESHVAAGRRFLRLDLSGVTFLDATALTGITRAHQALLRRKGTLVITGVRTLVARVLRLTGLDEVLFVGGPRADDDLPLPPGVNAELLGVAG